MPVYLRHSTGMGAGNDAPISSVDRLGRVRAVLELYGNEGQRSVPDVQEVMNHLFAVAKAEVLRVPCAISAVDDLAVGIVTTRLPIRRDGPEIIQRALSGC